MSKISLKDLLTDSELRKDFMEDSGISSRPLNELLDANDEETLIS
jgi:hypothetical protein